MAAGLRTALSEAYQTDGNWDGVSANDFAERDSDGDLLEDMSQYVDQVRHDENGVIQVLMGDGANARVAGTSFTLDPDESGDRIRGWTCAGAAVLGGEAMESRYLPSSCR
ncbi:pilin [Ectothiorhodospira variabilis]|nr:pilin [Ectothiorhodospira variabilis]